MIKTEIIKAKIENRILVTDAPIFSGESVQIRLDFNCGEAEANKHKIVLFGSDKKALAEASFFANADGVWIANLNTATEQMAAYFKGVPVDATKSIGAMVVNRETADVITRGNVLVVCTPFPSELVPCPQTYAYVTTEELSSSMAEVESEISGKADASDFIQLSSTVADLSSAVANKADSSTVATLADDLGTAVADLSAALSGKADQNTVEGLAEIISELDSTKADSSTVADLAAEVEEKADASELESTEKKREVLEAETISEKINLTSSELAANWYLLTSDTPQDSCLMRIYSDDAETTSTVRQFYITFAHLPNRVEIQYTNSGPNGYYDNIFGLVSEYNTNFQPPSAEGWYSYRFSFCPAYDFYYAELLAYRPI